MEKSPISHFSVSHLMSLLYRDLSGTSRQARCDIARGDKEKVKVEREVEVEVEQILHFVQDDRG